MTKRSSPAGPALRSWAWALGAFACLGYYAVKNTHLGHSNPVGRETALFPRWNLDLQLLESPAGKRWILTHTEAFFGRTPTPPGWPSATMSPRRFTFWDAVGTWEPHGRALRRVWRFEAEKWVDEQHLRGTPPASAGGDSGRLHLDLGSGRTSVRPWSWEDSVEDYEDELYDEEPDLLSVLNSPLEPVPDDSRFRKQRRFSPGGRKVYLLWAPWTKGERHPIYAASDDAAPRLLKVVDDGVPLELARDGRTLFFSRGNVLWRLDLRKPLPELLDAVPLPTLPEPPLK